jgi:hypothetical protein
MNKECTNYFKSKPETFAGQKLTPIVIPVLSDLTTSLKIEFAKWFDHLFSFNSLDKSVTPLELSHDKSNKRYSVELLHQAEKPTDLLLAFVNDQDNTPIGAIEGESDFCENGLLGKWFSKAVNLAKPHIEDYHHRKLEKGKTYSIGRDEKCNIHLRSPNVSRNHAIVEVGNDGKITVIDTTSTNGTFVDETKIKGPIEIRDGAFVKFADTTIRFSLLEDDLNSSNVS